MLTAIELQTIKEFIDLLKPLEEATKIVCGESYVTASKTIPVINILKRKLEMYLPITDTAKHLRKTLMEQFAKRFENIEKMSIIAVATLLDPRFKKIHFFYKIACSRAIDKISKALSNVEKQKDKEPLPEVEKNQDGDFWAYHNQLVEQINSNRESREDELFHDLKHYLNQPNISMKNNPIKYWNSHLHSPLSELAKRYLSIVATSVPSEPLFSKAGRIITHDRSRISSKHLQQFLFLCSLSKEDWLFF